MMSEFSLSKEDVPSFYLLTKNSPEFEPVSVNISDTTDFTYYEEGIGETNALDDEGEKEDEQISRRIAELEDKNEFDVDTVLGIQVEKINGAKIKGTYQNYLQLMMKKHEEKLTTVSGDFIVIDSYDGAEHSRNDEGRTNVLSYSSQVFNNQTLAMGTSTSSSFNILTWMQMVGEEKPANIFPVVKDHYDEKHRMRSASSVVENCTFNYYDCHDGKMLYILTQHGLWNRKFAPFLLCKCKRGDAVESNTHECQIISNEEQVTLYSRSERRFNRAKDKHGEGYSRGDHMDWADKNNNGVTHFGIHPNKLRRDGIRFDIFHLRSAITRLLLNYLRRFIRAQTCSTMEAFAEILSNAWGPYHMSLWKCNKALTSLKGKQILKFIKTIPKVVEFLYENFVDTEKLKAFCNALEKWNWISAFISITTVVKLDATPSEESEQKADYVQKLDLFDQNVRTFYECGAKTFLTRSKVGDSETFYAHVLRCYLPKHARTTWETHSLGLGVFNMQGFERRNKESKNTMRRFTNKKGNMALQNMKRLWYVFFMVQHLSKQ